MLSGAGYGGILTALLPLIGLVTILRARKTRKRETAPVDVAFEKRLEATRESERRMAAYLAQRGLGNYDALEGDEQEIRR